MRGGQLNHAEAGGSIEGKRGLRKEAGKGVLRLHEPKNPEGKGAVIGGVSKQSQTGRSRQPPSQQQAHTRAFLRCNCALSENSTAFVCEQRSQTCCVRAGQDPVCPMCRVQKSCYDRQGGQPVENIYYKYTLCTRPKRREGGMACRCNGGVR